MQLIRVAPGKPGRGILAFGRGIQMATLKSFLRDESGATAIEYGLVAAGISVAIITVVQGLGTKLNDTFGKVSNAMN
jgi:pilus assembly protein Flp/PilA